MKTIKIIDLFNMISKGEQVPKKIKWGDTKYTIYTDEVTKQTYYQDDECKYFFLHLKCLDDLNDEVEIIEEKKLPEKINVKGSYDSNKGYEDFNDNEKILVDKINGIIDYLESKEKGE